MTKLSAIVITKNEEKMIGDCLQSLHFADEIILVDTGNTDQTNSIAQKHSARIITYSGPRDFSAYRNFGLTAAQYPWVLYLDADERITPELHSEILKIISSSPSASAFAIPRNNIFLGKLMRYGGWTNDYVIRLFKRTALKKWIYPLHEQPTFTGSMEKLSASMDHISHRDLSSMLQKTISYTSYEAQLLHQAHHPPVTWWRILRMMLTEFWHRFIRLSAWRDGTPGIIDGLFQVFNTFIIYTRLWEIQQQS